MRPNPHARLTLTQLALVFGVSKQLVRYWITSNDIEPDGAKTYRLADIAAIELRTRRSPQSRRTAAA